MKSVGIFGITPETRLKLKLLSVAHNKTMAEYISSLINEAYERDKSPISKEVRRKVRRIIKKWA